MNDCLGMYIPILKTNYVVGYAIFTNVNGIIAGTLDSVNNIFDITKENTYVKITKLTSNL